LREDLFFAGQITGIEGYTGNIASGLLAGVNMARWLRHQELLIFPDKTLIGALHQYISKTELFHFQPMKAIFGLLPPLEHRILSKRERAFAHAKRSLSSIRDYIKENMESVN
jgi:methylenetetrahydrofolate--tRNA-(uracil-5-)-methyltransferase